jgi:hypothetical protein
MSNVERGKLILKEVPAGEIEKKVVTLLSKFAKSASIEELTEKVRNTPYALSNDIAAEKAVLILEAFQKFGATAVFIPHVTEKPEAERFTPVQLITILLLLSLGYLTWQLWPVLGDKVIELWSYLKQLV